MAWSQFRKNLFSGSAPDEPAAERPPESRPSEPARPMPEVSARPTSQPMSLPTSLDAIGQRNESVRQRIDVMSDRLDDLKSLQDDFASIVAPLAAMSEELSRSSARVTELQALLTQEQQNTGTARRESSELAGRVASTGHELASALARAVRIETDLGERDNRIEELRIGLRDKTQAADILERQLASEIEQAKGLQAENKGLRLEAQSVDQALARSEHELTELRERHHIVEQDNHRLNALSEDQSVRLADLGARHDEVQATAEAERQRLRALETQLLAETANREKKEGQYETEISTHRTERAGLTMKLEAALNRLTATEQLAGQLRSQLREKDDAVRLAERTQKEMSLERVTADRRIESLQADLARQADRTLELQRGRSDLLGRCDMLTKALAAREAGLDQSVSQVSALSDRIEQLTHRHEADRAQLETANSKLLEELQNERSERAMAVGALEISRESRTGLQKQYEALKRSARGWRGDTPEPPSEPVDDAQASSNVRPFTAPTKAT